MLTDTGSTVGSQMCPFNTCYLLYPWPDIAIWGACGVGRVVDTAVVWVLMLRMFPGAANQPSSSTGKMILWLCRDSLRNVFWPGWRNVHLIRQCWQILFYLAWSHWILLPDPPLKCLLIIRWEVMKYKYFISVHKHIFQVTVFHLRSSFLDDFLLLSSSVHKYQYFCILHWKNIIFTVVFKRYKFCNSLIF